jgi:hypothetical protein
VNTKLECLEKSVDLLDDWIVRALNTCGEVVGRLEEIHNEGWFDFTELVWAIRNDLVYLDRELRRGWVQYRERYYQDKQ